MNQPVTVEVKLAPYGNEICRKDAVPGTMSAYESETRHLLTPTVATQKVQDDTGVAYLSFSVPRMTES